MQRRSYNAGEKIFEAGDNSDVAYLVVIGNVSISIPGKRKETEIAELGPGEVFGEMGLIDAGPRSASATATEYTVCACYDADELLSSLEAVPDEVTEIIAHLIRRLREMNSKLNTETR